MDELEMKELQSLSWKDLINQFRKYDKWHENFLNAMKIEEFQDMITINEADIAKSKERHMIEKEILERCRTRNFEPSN